MKSAADIQIIEGILKREGVDFTDDPVDAGGPTKFGITLKTFAAFRGGQVTQRDVEQLTRDEAAEIYAARYLRPFDGLPEPLRENVIDMGVNAGVDRATRLLQQLIGAEVDGVMGPRTRVQAAQAHWNEGYCYMRLAFYESLIERKPSQMRFRNGWRTRALSFRK